MKPGRWKWLSRGWIVSYKSSLFRFVLAFNGKLKETLFGIWTGGKFVRLGVPFTPTLEPLWSDFRRMTLKTGFGKCALFVLSANV